MLVAVEKRCPHCELVKPATREHFHRDRNSPTLCASWCKGCFSRGRRRLTSAERFWPRVDKSSGPDACWPWTGAKHRRGYGRFGHLGHGHESFAHRFAYADTHGTIPEGLHVRHKCDNPACCNPRHLELGTHLDNMADMAARKRCPPRYGERSPTAKLTAGQVLLIRQRLARGERRATIAADFGVKPVTVSAIKTRRLWAHL